MADSDEARENWSVRLPCWFMDLYYSDCIYGEIIVKVTVFSFLTGAVTGSVVVSVDV